MPSSCKVLTWSKSSNGGAFIPSRDLILYDGVETLAALVEAARLVTTGVRIPQKGIAVRVADPVLVFIVAVSERDVGSTSTGSSASVQEHRRHRCAPRATLILALVLEDILVR